MTTNPIARSVRATGRRHALRLVAGGAAALGGLAFAAGTAGAQGEDVIGSWITYIHLEEEGDDIHMMTIAPGGILLFSGEGPLIPSPIPGLDEFWFNPGHGAWTRAADGTVQGHFVVIVQDRNETPKLFAHVRPRLTLSGPDQLTGSATFDFIPIGETEPVATLKGTVEATRVRV
jgi:hypothetical protein